jgi:hypothetical protein
MIDMNETQNKLNRLNIPTLSFCITCKNRFHQTKPDRNIKNTPYKPYFGKREKKFLSKNNLFSPVRSFRTLLLYVCNEILHAYGDEKWNYPDPKCPYAPTKMRSFYVE